MTNKKEVPKDFEKKENIQEEEIMINVQNPFGFDADAMAEQANTFIQNMKEKITEEKIKKAKKTALTIGIAAGTGMLVGYLVGKNGSHNK